MQQNFLIRKSFTFNIFFINIFLLKLNIILTLWRSARAVDWSSLENCRTFVAYRGFESHLLLHLKAQILMIWAFNNCNKISTLCMYILMSSLLLLQ